MGRPVSPRRTRVDACHHKALAVAITSMKGIKRSVRKFGRVLGHHRPLSRDVLLPYLEARQQIYLPAYRWVLENKVTDLVEQLRKWRDGPRSCW